MPLQSPTIPRDEGADACVGEGAIESANGDPLEGGLN